MFFKNGIVFELKGSLELPEESLSRMKFVPCNPSDHESHGFVPPRGKENGALVESVGGNRMIAFMTEIKVIPSDAMKREVKSRADAIAEHQGHAPGRKQMKEIKERVLEDLLPRAMTKRNTVYAWISEKYLVINSATWTKAESVIEALRLCLESFPLAMIKTRISAQSAMADWLAGGEAPSGFTIDRDCEVKSIGEEKATVRYVHHPLADEVSDEIKAHLAAGKLPTKLALTWDERISFVLTEKLEIKRLAFLDIIKQQADEASETADEQFDADFAIMAGEMSRFLDALFDALGGIDKRMKANPK